MKTKFYVVTVLIFTVLTSLVSCSEDDDTSPSSQIVAPCGTIESNEVNITLLNDQGLDVTAVALSIDGETQSLSLEGWDFANDNYYTCWQTIPSINNSLEVVLQFVLNDEPIVGIPNLSDVTTNQIEIELSADSAVFRDYTICE